MRKRVLAVFFLIFCFAAVAQQTMNNDAVIKMVKAGLSDDLIVTTINSDPGKYDTSVNGLIALKQAGVSDKVVAAMVSKNATPAAAQNLDSVPRPCPAQPSPAPAEPRIFLRELKLNRNRNQLPKNNCATAAIARLIFSLPALVGIK